MAVDRSCTFGDEGKGGVLNGCAGGDTGTNPLGLQVAEAASCLGRERKGVSTCSTYNLQHWVLSFSFLFYTQILGIRKCLGDSYCISYATITKKKLICQTLAIFTKTLYRGFFFFPQECATRAKQFPFPEIVTVSSIIQSAPIALGVGGLCRVIKSSSFRGLFIREPAAYADLTIYIH